MKNVYEEKKERKKNQPQTTRQLTFDFPVLIDEQIGALEIPVDEGRVVAVQPVHAKRRVLRHQHAATKRELDVVVVEQLLDVAARHVLLDDEEVARHGAGAHEQADVGVEKGARNQKE
jgi:hypothetical protein